jgi:hypothetical protein
MFILFAAPDPMIGGRGRYPLVKENVCTRY